MKRKVLGILLLCWAFVTGLNAQNEFGHVIKEDKGLSKTWIKSLTSPGEQKVYKGEELKTIGMPCGGVAAGQLYVRGDGSLACWWIANNAYNTGYGIDHLLNFDTPNGPWKVCYQTFEPMGYVEQYFELSVKSDQGTETVKLNKSDFDNIGFIGEYPIAKINYKDSKKKLPVAVNMEVFSPFVPLDAKSSANPATILKFKVKNTSSKSVDVNLNGALQNPVMMDLKDVKGKLRNQIKRSNGVTSLYMDFIPEDAQVQNHPYFGNIALSVINNEAKVNTRKGDSSQLSEVSREEKLVGEVITEFKLAAGEEKEITYLLTWFFPNRPMHYGGGGNWNKPIPTKGPSIGNMYANWFDSSLDVANQLKANFAQLTSKTYSFHDTWYNNSTLPYWLRQRIMMPVSTLATETCQWWANDKFWAWEGVGSCVGTCTHVYNYEQAIARLFPELERNIREKTDYGTSYQNDGAIAARNGWGGILLDGHIGAIMKAYREYLMSKDKFFLSRNWGKIKKSMEYVIARDGDMNGLIEGRQSNTYDISFMGPNTYVGGLYLGALRAAKEMALVMNDKGFAKHCEGIFENGKNNSVKRLWNEHYFVQEVDLKMHPKFQYATGCLSDQMFGQTWAHQLNLGYIYPEQYVKKTLESIWKYNWTKDVGPHIKKFVPERYYAHEGEPGLLNCTWPISEHLNENAVRYRNEVWTGIEYQVATNMIYDGMIEEGLSIVKGVHERYRPEKHNPWNEIECGDHYARALASWGILIALEDYFYNGPEGILKFNPRIQKNNFTSFFTAAEGWGNISQTKKGAVQTNTIELKYGQLKLNQLTLAASEARSVSVAVNGVDQKVKWDLSEGQVTITGLNLDLKQSDKVIVKIK
ncbi:hypothetical protein EYV94_15520 [Puteibacter caeruleilacunae]|nr:hypothetical protein EYV94_15520 [Puteibacter caeruleilacunae]